MANAISAASLPPTDRSGATRQPLILVSHIAKAFGETKALRDVSFSAVPGEIHAIVGENGSGKSTLAKVLSGIVKPDSGSALVGGVVVDDPRKALREGVATVFQEVLIAEGLSIADNVYMGLDGPWHSSRSRRAKLADAGDLLTRLIGRPIDASAIIDTLALAEQQWITIARALVRDPRVVIFDESTAALDLGSARRLYAEMTRLKGEGVCVLVVTHRIAELTSFADRATVLRDGKDVGVVAGGDITLDHLLDLMSGADASQEVVRLETLAEERKRSINHSAVTFVADAVTVAPGGRPSSLELHAGEIIGFAGLDGQGQAEFLQAITGVRERWGGDVSVQGSANLRSLRDAVAAGVVYISGDRRKEGIFPNLSIFENFAMPLYTSFLRFGFISRRRLGRLYAEQASVLSLKAGSPQDLVTTLSGGNQQKVIIGRALAQAPKVVALNDPARGVDIRTKRELYAQLERLAAQGTGIVYLSSEIDELVDLCDRVAVFRDAAIFEWLDADAITSELILASMFGHAEVDFDSANALVTP